MHDEGNHCLLSFVKAIVHVAVGISPLFRLRFGAPCDDQRNFRFGGEFRAVVRNLLLFHCIVHWIVEGRLRGKSVKAKG